MGPYVGGKPRGRPRIPTADALGSPAALQLRAAWSSCSWERRLRRRRVGLVEDGYARSARVKENASPKEYLLAGWWD